MMLKWVDLLGFLGVFTLLFGFTAYLTAYFVAKALQRFYQERTGGASIHEIFSTEKEQQEAATRPERADREKRRAA